MKHRHALFTLALVGAVVLGGCDILLRRSPGEKVWRKHCAECHGLDGAGNTPRYMGETYADLTDDLWKAGGSDGAMEQVIVQGVFGKMPATQLNKDEMRAVISYVHELRGERGPGTSN